MWGTAAEARRLIKKKGLAHYLVARVPVGKKKKAGL